MNQNQPMPIRSSRTDAAANRVVTEFGMAPALQAAASALQAPIVEKNLNRALNIEKPLVASGGATVRLSWLDFFLKIPMKCYNAAFTQMGRKNLRYFLKKSFVRINGDFRARGTLVYSLKNGRPFVLHAGNRLSELFYLEGDYEPLESRIVAKVVLPGDTVFDLGANVGFFTAELDALVQPDGEVHAFEPGDGTFAKLQKTKSLLNLDRSVLHQKALGETVGEVDFWSSTIGNDAAQKSTQTPAFARELRHHQVPLTTLDAVVKELGAERAKKIAFVKCDIEGAEPAMLRGAKKLLESENPPVWLMEHNREALVEHGMTSADLLKFFDGAEIYFVPLCWPPSEMSVAQAQKWNGVPESLPDECNLAILPKRGIFAERVTALRAAKLLS
jgi:FkbM family methyltransferase